MGRFEVLPTEDENMLTKENYNTPRVATARNGRRVKVLYKKSILVMYEDPETLELQPYAKRVFAKMVKIYPENFR